MEIISWLRSPCVNAWTREKRNRRRNGLGNHAISPSAYDRDNSRSTRLHHNNLVRLHRVMWDVKVGRWCVADAPYCFAVFRQDSRDWQDFDKRRCVEGGSLLKSSNFLLCYAMTHMQSAIEYVIVIYLFGSLLSGIIFLIADIRNNLSYGRVNLLHTLARLPIVIWMGPFYICGIIYLAMTNKKRGPK